MPVLKRPSTSFSGESGSSSWPSLKRPWCSVPGDVLVRDAAGVVRLEVLLGRVRLVVGAGLEALFDLLGRGGMIVMFHTTRIPADAPGQAEATRPCARAHSIVRRNVSATGRVGQAQLARRARAVVPMTVEQGADHLPAHRRLAPADAVGGLDGRAGGPRGRRGQDPHAMAHPGQRGDDLQRLGRRDRGAAEHVALAGAAPLGAQQVPGHAVVDVDEADVRVHERLQAPVEVGDQDAARAARAPRALHGGRVDGDQLDAGAARGGERRQLALVLRALVDREVGAAMRRVLAPDRALGLPERGRRGGQHDPRHARARGGADGELGAAHVRVEQGGGVLRAHRVDARHVVEQLAARHARRERVLVEDVAARHASSPARPGRARRRPSAPARRPRRRARRAGSRAPRRSARCPPVRKTRLTAWRRPA